MELQTDLDIDTKHETAHANICDNCKIVHVCHRCVKNIHSCYKCGKMTYECPNCGAFEHSFANLRRHQVTSALCSKIKLLRLGVV